MKVSNMNSGLLILFLEILELLSCITSSAIDSRTIVHTSSGPIQGSVVNVDGRTVYQYLGIPYAQPPLGNLRFRKPKPVQPWSKTLNANKMPPACMQYSVHPFPWYDSQVGKSEDCLYLNVWIPEAKEGYSTTETKKSVMFWIHGGAFAIGSVRLPDYDGRALAAIGDVIVVTTNYRLGAFGFFTTDTDAAPANVALHDLLEALKWVKKNIDSFGGDPNQVTLFGESAGSIISGLFCVSPLTKGLFNRVIMQSGSPAAALFDVNTTSILEASQKLAEALGCADARTNVFTSPDQVVDCMKDMNASQIAKTLNSFNPNIGMVYTPTYGNEFLPYSTREALKSGNFHDVRLLIGNTLDELSFAITVTQPEIFGFFGEKLPKLSFSDEENLLNDILTSTFNGTPDAVSQIIRENLKKDGTRNNLKVIYDLLGDFVLTCPDVYFAESYSRRGKDVFFYFFEHRPSTTPWASWMGVVHYEDVQFVFGAPLKENKYTSEEVELSRLMMKMWSDFAKYGDPLPSPSVNSDPGFGNVLDSGVHLKKWPLYSRETPLYLILDNTTSDTIRYGLGPRKENCNLFRTIHGFP